MKILLIYNFPAKFGTHDPEAEFKLKPVLHVVHEDPEVQVAQLVGHDVHAGVELFVDKY